MENLENLVSEDASKRNKLVDAVVIGAAGTATTVYGGKLIDVGRDKYSKGQNDGSGNIIAGLLIMGYGMYKTKQYWNKYVGGMWH